MFQEAEDIKSFLTPFALPDDVLAKATEEMPQASLRFLFDHLSSFLETRSNEKSALLSFIVENGVDEWINEGFDAFEERFLKTLDEAPVDLSAIYTLAVSLFDAGKIDDAVALFTIISTLSVSQAPVLSAMAACACHQMRYQHGFDLAEESLAQKERHPRTHLIAGYCALQMKDLKNAKRYLALTSRLARNDPNYRKEQRFAQRELLMIQFSS